MILVVPYLTWLDRCKALPGRDCRLQETDRCLPAFAPPCFSLLHRNFVILLNRYLSILVKKGWGHGLDVSGDGGGRVVFGRAGRGLSVRPLHTRGGSLRKRQRSPTPRGELPAPREALIARDSACQSAARSLRRAPPALRTTDPARQQAEHAQIGARAHVELAGGARRHGEFYGAARSPCPTRRT